MNTLFLNVLVAVCVLCLTFNHVSKYGVAAEEAASGAVMDGITPEMEAQIEAKRESFTFQAEVSRLMDIIINSLYKNREVFLRELISNASDALDKLRFLAVSNKELMDGEKAMDIKISFNKDLNTLTIQDTGLGMTKDELVNNLGTLAKSGTKKFLEQMQEGSGDANLIGQFGVGFYSVYLVADKVRVISKNPSDSQYIWESTAESSFTISPDPRGNTLGRGTEITMFLKEDAAEFLDQARLEEIVKKHSEFITFPISLYKMSSKMVDVEPEEKEKPVDEDGMEISEEDGEEPAAPKQEKVETWDWEVLNGDVAIWSRDAKEITDEEYQKFYKVISSDPTDAKTWIHFKAEGEVEFKSILFIPEDAGNLYDDYSNRKAGVRLYVKKVLIQDDFEDLLPKYLNFIRGVADSDDLPLNVSRETLQQHKILKVMGKKLVRKVLEMLRKLTLGPKKPEGEEESDDDDETAVVEDANHPYIKFWEQFGKSIKMGVIEDAPNRSKLAKLLRFKSSKSGDNYVSLEEYVKNKPEWQKGIFYIPGESIEACEKSPFAEVAKRKGVEVLYLYDPVDEYCIQNLGDFDGFKLNSLTKENIKFGDENEDDTKKRVQAYREMFKPLTTYMKDMLAGKVTKVGISTRVEQTPSIITTSQYGHTANMERIMRAQTFANPDAYKSMQAQKTLELNPRHPLVAELLKKIEDMPDDQSTKDLAYILYDTALISSGFTYEGNDVEEFSARMIRTMASGLSLSSMDLLPEIEIPDEPEEEEEDADDDASTSDDGSDEL